jgi:prolyl oligopeptidase
MLRIPAVLLLTLALPRCSAPAAGTPGDPPAYPAAARVEQVDTYHGVEVRDPYRWLENEDAPQTRAWVEAQRDLLDGYVGDGELVADLERRIARFRDFDGYGTPLVRGKLVFTTKTPVGHKHPTLYAQRGPDGEPRALMRVAEAIDDDTHGFGGYVPGRDGRHVAWASLAPTGWGFMRVLRVEDGRQLEERLQGVAGNSAVWTHDGRGFFYLAYGDYEALQAGATAVPRLYYHRLGRPQSEDELLFSTEDGSSAWLSAKLGDEGRYLVLTLFEGDRSANRVVYRDLASEDPAWVTLIGDADARYTFEGNVGRRFFFQTTLDAPRGRLVIVDLDDPRRDRWRELIPEREATMTAVSHIGGKLVVRSTRDARPVVEVFGTDGRRVSSIDLPTIGLLSGFNDDPGSSTAFYRLNSLHDPGTIYRVDVESGESEVFRRPDLGYDPDDFVIRQVFYRSKDGTRVPMFVVHRKGIELDGKSPLFMYGYGHGGWVAFPWFQPHLVAWLDLGGIYALPGLRGGGEYGAEWTEAGTRLNKQNTIDDFIAAAEYLVAEGYTSAERLVANGGSASGVLAAAAIVQRPGLFGAAVVEFPFIDMLRYHEFQVIKGWTRGYGSSADPREFEVLRSYSPLHNLKSGACYPAVLTVVAGEDTSTVPMHGYKFTAALQEAQGCGRPAMMKLIPGVGHYSYGSDRQEQIENQAQILAFMARALDLDW